MSDARAIKLLKARSERQSLTDLPGGAPVTREEAYALQDETLALSGRESIGWKIGLVPEEHRARFQAARFSGPILNPPGCLPLENGIAEIDIPAYGLNAIEFELAFRLGQPIDPGAWLASGVAPMSAMDAAFCAVERLASPVVNLAEHGPGAVAGDMGINNGMILGPEFPLNKGELGAPCIIRVSEAGKDTKTGGEDQVPDGIAGALSFLFEDLSKRGRNLEKGDWILSGALCGQHPVTGPTTITAEFEGVGRVTIVARSSDD